MGYFYGIWKKTYDMLFRCAGWGGSVEGRGNITNLVEGIYIYFICPSWCKIWICNLIKTLFFVLCRVANAGKSIHNEDQAAASHFVLKGHHHEKQPITEKTIVEKQPSIEKPTIEKSDTDPEPMDGTMSPVSPDTGVSASKNLKSYKNRWNWHLIWSAFA